MEPMLKVTDLAVSYGHVEALRGINVEVHKGRSFPSLVPTAQAKPRCCARFPAW